MKTSLLNVNVLKSSSRLLPQMLMVSSRFFSEEPF